MIFNSSSKRHFDQKASCVILKILPVILSDSEESKVLNPDPSTSLRSAQDDKDEVFPDFHSCSSRAISVSGLYAQDDRLMRYKSCINQ